MMTEEKLAEIRAKGRRFGQKMAAAEARAKANPVTASDLAKIFFTMGIGGMMFLMGLAGLALFFGLLH